MKQRNRVSRSSIVALLVVVEEEEEPIEADRSSTGPALVREAGNATAEGAGAAEDAAAAAEAE